MRAKEKHSADDGLDRTKVGVAGAGKANDFAAHTVFLTCEGEGSKRRHLEFGVGGAGEVQTRIANEELRVGQTERVLVVIGVFARAQEKEESDDNHIASCAVGLCDSVRCSPDSECPYD